MSRSDKSREQDEGLDVFEAIDEIKESLRKAHPARRGGPDGWERIVRHIARHDSLNGQLVTEIEEEIARARSVWTERQKRTLWYSTRLYVIDDDAPDRCDPDDELGGPEDDEVLDSPDPDEAWELDAEWLDFALGDELLHDVVSVAWQEARRGPMRRSAPGSRRRR